MVHAAIFLYSHRKSKQTPDHFTDVCLLNLLYHVRESIKRVLFVAVKFFYRFNHRSNVFYRRICLNDMNGIENITAVF